MREYISLCFSCDIEQKNLRLALSLGLQISACANLWFSLFRALVLGRASKFLLRNNKWRVDGYLTMCKLLQPLNNKCQDLIFHL